MNKLLLLAASVAISGFAMSADIEAGKAKSAVCAGCHGAKGVSMIPTYPNLAGQKAPYMESALKAFKSQERTGANAAIMYGMAAPLSDADIANISAYFASLDPAGK